MFVKKQNVKKTSNNADKYKITREYLSLMSLDEFVEEIIKIHM